MTGIHPFKAVYPLLDKIFLSEAFFENVKNLFPIFYQNGYYADMDKNAIYIYQQYDGSRTYTGFITKTHIDNYFKGRIVRHELTLASKEERQFQLLHERNGYTKPILLTYPKVKEVDAFLKKYTNSHKRWYSLHFRGTKSTFWKITDTKTIEQLIHTFEKSVPKTYIADGHHRTATLAKYYHAQKGKNPNHTGNEPYNYLFTAYFAASELAIYDFNRIIKGLNGNSPLSFMAKLSKISSIKPVKQGFSPKGDHSIGMYLGGEWFRLKWSKKILKKYYRLSKAEQLDVSILNQEVLHKILDIENVRQSKRIEYLEGNKGLGTFENKVLQIKDDGVGFTLPKIAIEDMFKVSDEGGIMPPKSTFFVPRMYNGLLTYRLDV